MEKLLFCAPCHFGLESVLKREVADLGLETVRVEDGKVFFYGEASDVPRANIRLRTAERVLLVVSEFEARTFDELFENVKALDWKRFLPLDARFWVAKANSVKSALFSPRDIQAIVKKAMVEGLKTQYGTDVVPETGA
ncbi:MAG: class I SAM-dependent RNA methyltransferase, partial [Lachnospiraceae bacterium]|nr:class I SAM-dependent RNA methyltransferase [Lachnospiraceae bacterium]